MKKNVLNTKKRIKMKRELIRIGTESNGSELSKANGFDILFAGFHEFVYLPDYSSNQLVNGTWRGAFGHIIKGHAMEWKQCNVVCLVFQKHYRS